MQQTAAVSATLRAPSASSLRAMNIFAIAAAVTFSATGAAPTPLFHYYQESFGLSSAMVTAIFAVYALSLLTALLTAGSLSDYVGRRPMIFFSLALNVVAMGLFATAHSAAWLIAARIAQGFATGVATTTLGATILDTDRARGPLVNSVTAFGGLTLGSIVAGALVSYAPQPEHLVYWLLLGASLIEALVLLSLPETTRSKPGALASLFPHVRVPRQARAALLRVTPVNVAAWALGGFYFSLMPALVRICTGQTLPIVSGGMTAALTLSGVIAVLVLRSYAPHKLLAFGALVLTAGVAITLTGVHAGSAATMLLGAIVAGFGFGAAFSGTMRIVIPLAAPAERAGLLSAFYVESYLAFALPAMLAGLLAPMLGLTKVADVFGGVVMALAIASAALIVVGRKKAQAN
jgi:MFS family permease